MRDGVVTGDRNIRRPGSKRERSEVGRDERGTEATCSAFFPGSRQGARGDITAHHSKSQAREAKQLGSYARRDIEDHAALPRPPLHDWGQSCRLSIYALVPILEDQVISIGEFVIELTGIIHQP
jgi:hypothetical protein